MRTQNNHNSVYRSALLTSFFKKLLGGNNCGSMRFFHFVQTINALSLAAPIAVLLSWCPLAAFVVFLVSAFLLLPFGKTGAIVSLFTWIATFTASFSGFVPVPAWFSSLFPYWLIWTIVCSSSHLLGAFSRFALTLRLLRTSRKHRIIYKLAMAEILSYENTNNPPDGISFQTVLRERLVDTLFKIKDLYSYFGCHCTLKDASQFVLLVVLREEYNYTSCHYSKEIASYLCPLIEKCDRAVVRSSIVLHDKYDEEMNEFCTWYDRSSQLYPNDPKNFHKSNTADNLLLRVSRYERELNSSDSERALAIRVSHGVVSPDNFPKDDTAARVLKLADCYDSRLVEGLRLRRFFSQQIEKLDKNIPWTSNDIPPYHPKKQPKMEPHYLVDGPNGESLSIPADKLGAWKRAQEQPVPPPDEAAQQLTENAIEQIYDKKTSTGDKQ